MMLESGNDQGEGGGVDMEDDDDEEVIEDEEEEMMIEEGGSALNNDLALDFNPQQTNNDETTPVTGTLPASVNPVNGSATPVISILTIKPLLKGKVIRTGGSQSAWEGRWGMGPDAFNRKSTSLYSFSVQCLLCAHRSQPFTRDSWWDYQCL